MVSHQGKLKEKSNYLALFRVYINFSVKSMITWRNYSILNPKVSYFLFRWIKTGDT